MFFFQGQTWEQSDVSSAQSMITNNVMVARDKMLGEPIPGLVLEERYVGETMLIFYSAKYCEASIPEISA